MNHEFGFQHLDVYQKALGILDTVSGLSGEGPIGPILASKAAEVMTAMIDALEAWPMENKKEALFRARHVAHHLGPLIEVAARNGWLDEEGAKRLNAEADSVSKMLYGLAKASGPRKEETAAV